MESADRASLQRRARGRYELSRLRAALLGAAPLVVIAALAVWSSTRPTATAGFGAVALLVGVIMLWWGRDLQRGVLPGMAAGLVPLILAVCANRVHLCATDGCSTLCVQACVLGGVVAGLAVASVGNRIRAGLGYWLSASATAMLIGAMGCMCIGYTGLVGLGIGFGAGTVPGLLRRAFRRERA